MDGDLGDFLRSRRARIQPADVGLASHGRRRVPGLRREEVAQLAGVSVDYYIRLEQGRGPSVSDAVLDAIARVLRLDETEHTYLRTVARPRPRPPKDKSAAQRVRPGLRLLLDTIDRAPAFIFGRRMDVLAWNALGDALNGWSRLSPAERSVPRQVFLEDAARGCHPEWEAVAAETVAYLRMDAARCPGDTELCALVGELSVKSEAFRRLWADHQVKEKTHGVKRINHPVAGELILPYETLTLPGDPEQTLVVYLAEPDTEAAERLAMLGSWALSAP
ncbi:helix-turn-helix transcriptional regulator [Streptomyces alboniger]|uniref:XRE family transcriptional regulator n=1 Tax=Streptomyces alboniger TaxID=132473 RepID=A0A5J6HFZ5_STRAD|nr:helix-turn-helix transcriptional regulator [Streptomyces alboniger]QEV18478.1 XRE family transcriptional regulator [Streptomyces alboniger]